MKHKKTVTTLALTMVTAMALSTTAFAGGHGGGHRNHRTTSKTYSVCSVVDCTLTGTHKHNGVNYYAHTYGDGHDYHIGNHWSGDGHSYHNTGTHY